MNWSRCSRTLLALLLLISLAAPVAAVTSNASNVPDQQRVGQERRATITLQDLYEDGTDEWTLRGRTRLTNATWTVRKVKLNGDTSSRTYTGRSFETTVASGNNTDRVEVVVRGRAPRVDGFSYDPPQRFEFARLSKVVGDNVDVVDTREVHHYTDASQRARNAIDQARPVVADAGNQQARDQLNRAIQAYESGEFELSRDLASDAESSARSAQQSSRTLRLALVGAGVVVVLAVVVGGVLYVRSQSGPGDPLG
ncbi:MAG: hypothetical protein V5A62_11595 [Haloarculaceae archaeon]